MVNFCRTIEPLPSRAFSKRAKVIRDVPVNHPHLLRALRQLAMSLAMLAALLPSMMFLLPAVHAPPMEMG